ncbi:hypothetical protein HU200_025643 [Digitaria exilis]|uniref:FLZ-type domain-containing protein n=1 Tax=Digitaria exilis TaxID=1010633 RepID=A0A835ESL3_9POAL|nr:hypothetical protein HU200_025643 [Digitaria exilis]
MVLRRSAVRIPASAASRCHDKVFVGLEFMKSCFCCHKKLDATMDVFVYKGEHAFCSAERRCQHMAREERREIEALIRKRRDAFHRRHAGAARMPGSNRLLRLQTTAAR